MGNSGVKHEKSSVNEEMETVNQKEEISLMEANLQNDCKQTVDSPEPIVQQDSCHSKLESSEVDTATTDKLRKVTKKVTIEQYRKTVGIKVINQKPSQKIGIAASSGTPRREEAMSPSVLGKLPQAPRKGTLCSHCGYTSAVFSNKCERCSRAFSDKVKIVDLPCNSTPVDEGKPTSPSLSLPKDVGLFYGNRRPRGRGVQSGRQERARLEEPQCVTLSSDDDEEDSYPEAKKLKQVTNPERASNTEDNEAVLNPAPLEVSGDSVMNGRFNSFEIAPTDSSSSIRPAPDEHISEESPSELNTFDEIGASNGTSLDLLRWTEGGMKGAFFAVEIRSIRIGSYKFSPVDRVLFSSEGIVLKAPVLGSDGCPSTAMVNVTVLTKNVLDMQVHFSRSLSVIFVRVCPSVSRLVSKELNLTKGKSPYWDTVSLDESQKRMTLLPHDLTETAKNAIKQAFALCGIYKEIPAAEAHDILVKSSPGKMARLALAAAEKPSNVSSSSYVANKENGSKIEMRITRSALSKTADRSAMPVELMFAWSDGPDRFPITTEDYMCLNQDNLLNDSIIDFYLRYVFSTKLDDDQKRKCHVFSSFFYQRLTTRPSRRNGRKDPVEDDNTLTMAQKRHARVKSWTKRVDVFEKDFLVIPINERSHWFLAVVCFPGLPGPVTMKENQPVQLQYSQLSTSNKAQGKVLNKFPRISGDSFMIGNTTVTPVRRPSKIALCQPVSVPDDVEKDEAESEDEEIPAAVDSKAASTTVIALSSSEQLSEPIKQPCILFFDSLAGGSHLRVAATLREYLMEEYRVKKQDEAAVVSGSSSPKSKLFSKEVMPSACPSVPQQNNSYDCGVYVLEYAECFMKDPLMDFNLSRISLDNWFPNHMASRKRKDIQSQLIRLTVEKNPLAESVLKLLPQEDVRLAFQSPPHVIVVTTELSKDTERNEEKLLTQYENPPMEEGESEPQADDAQSNLHLRGEPND